jgi:hypothetical protein
VRAQCSWARSTGAGIVSPVGHRSSCSPRNRPGCIACLTSRSPQRSVRPAGGIDVDDQLRWGHLLGSAFRVPVAGALFLFAGHLADRRVNVDHQSARCCGHRPGALAGHVVDCFELADMTDLDPRRSVRSAPGTARGHNRVRRVLGRRARREPRPWHDQFAGRYTGVMRPSQYLNRNVRVMPSFIELVERYFERNPHLSDVYAFGSDFPHREGARYPAHRASRRLEHLGPEIIEK